jgi:hypothetical protein
MEFAEMDFLKHFQPLLEMQRKKARRPKMEAILYAELEPVGDLDNRLEEERSGLNDQSLPIRERGIILHHYCRDILNLGRKIYSRLEENLEKEHSGGLAYIVLSHQTPDQKHHLIVVKNHEEYESGEIDKLIRKNYPFVCCYLHPIGKQKVDRSIHVLTPMIGDYKR